MIDFLDSSALAKAYVRERGSPFVVRALAAPEPVAVSRLAPVEIASAVARRAREGALGAAQRDAILRDLRSDERRWRIVELTRDVADIARDLALRHALRAYDAAQLASALWIEEAGGGPVRFVASDAALLGAAEAAGLAVANPEAP